MCRWALWSGEPAYIADLIFTPAHSLIHQSRAAHSCKTTVNADGFGIAWYDRRPEPGIYKDVRPAWSDPNLMQIARQLQSGLFLAHVRASTGTATSYDNCHPFACDRWSFMHNGQIGGYGAIRRHLEAAIPDTLYPERHGTTDSEALFLTACGFGLDRDPIGAMARAVGHFEAGSRQGGSTPHMRFTACWSNGNRSFAARYASDAFAPSLYWQRQPGGVLVVSEPLDDAPSDWTEVAPGSVLEICGSDVAVHDFSPFEMPGVAA